MEIAGRPGSHALSAFFDDESDAEKASEELMEAGIPKDAITMTPGNRPDVPLIDHIGFVDALNGFFFTEEQRKNYAEALRRGGALVTVQEVSKEQHDTALNILTERGSIDMDERVEEWRRENWK
ncbi:hypothetical protein QA646_26885 (plasmid) [Rhizobium sp. CB3090]|uniref:hypothetical protein n=1 Tax=Rhizobium sp. CB3090 TaxID=3039156 RepID=UPI0024B107A5|nr:hypothetical protein [Rhizobium sp. CB3090]WFU12003.1 hypothetical protein QA646_26885 [Rhizobium sp. CB3090]